MGSIGSGGNTNNNYISSSTIRNTLEEEGYEFTNNPENAIYVLRDGGMVDGQIYDGIRSEDHRMIESLFEDIDRYTDDFWIQMFNRTGLLMLIPENKQAMTSTSVKLTQEQEKILKQLGYELIKE